MNVYTSAEMRAFDNAASTEGGIPSIVLMENAALRVVEFLETQFAPLSTQTVLILCGKGNNGGDGLAVARHLLPLLGPQKLTVVSGPAQVYRGDALVNLLAWQKCHGAGQCSHIWPVEPSPAEQKDLEERLARLPAPDIVLDCVLGTGLKMEEDAASLRYPAASLLNVIRPWPPATSLVHVDLPSGLQSESGQYFGPPLGERPRHTVTFVGPKRGFFVRDGVTLCGPLWVGNIGTGPAVPADPACAVTGHWEARSLLPQRTRDAHKGDAGRVLLVGGSPGMSGALALAATASLRAGAGLCLAALPAPSLPLFAPACLEATSHPLPWDSRGLHVAEALAELKSLWGKMSVLGIGPGLGREATTLDLVRQVARQCPVPLVVDADALYALPAIATEVAARDQATILTPHPGEMGELMGLSARQVNEARYEVASQCARRYGAIVVLKGAFSLVAFPDGSLYVNLSGNPGMASGGSGDVLTGTISGLLAQLKNAQAATRLGVYLHGLAGDIAAGSLGNGLLAGDIAAALPAALLQLGSHNTDSGPPRLRLLQ